MATNDSIYEELVHSVGKAVEVVVNIESTWSPEVMTNRIVGYIYKAVRKELPLSSREAIQNMVDSAMQSFSGACQDKPWFSEINLVHAFVGVIMVVEKQEGHSHGEIQEIESLVRIQHDNYKERILLNRALWASVEATFKDHNVAVKVYHALNKTWDSVFEESMAEIQWLEESISVPDMTRMQKFIKRWMQKSMWRCSDYVANSENVTLLFENCVRPFGNDHPFSCIPKILYSRCGDLPPKNWSYIRDEAKNMFDQWEQMHDQWERKKSAPSMKRPSTSIIDIDHRHRSSTSSSDPENANENASSMRSKRVRSLVSEIEDQLESSIFRSDPEEEDEGHPQCTSKEDCIGSAEDLLVQHILPGARGDIYCTSCFSCFRERGDYEARYTDTGEMFL